MTIVAISVVIPTHNRGASLAVTLSAALADPAAGEVVVVLDGCTDGSAAMVCLMSEADPRLRILELSPNEGPQRARLAGVRAATSAVVLCVDDDVVLATDCVTGHCRAHAEQRADVVVGYMPVASESFARLDPVQERYSQIYDSHTQVWLAEPVMILRTLWGGNVSFCRDDYLQAAGRCDMSLRYHEDQELGLVLEQMGRSAVFDPTLKAAHLYERDVEALLGDLSRGGDAYAILVARYPGILPSWTETFAPEIRSRFRRSLVKMASERPARALLLGCYRLAERTALTGGIARALLALLGRSAYYQGFSDSVGRSSLQ